MIKFFNIKQGGSGGGDGSSLNVFAQLDEPAVKKGIWLKAEKDIQKINYDEEIFISGEYMPDGVCSAIPANFCNGATAIVGDDIYLFGFNSQYSRDVYKYNITTDTYTQLNCPASSFRGFYKLAAAVVGTDIYLFGGQQQSRTLFKYDTITETYTKLTDIPYGFYAGAAVAIGTDIYLFGGAYQTDNGYRYTYKYNTLTGTWTQLTDNINSAGFQEGNAVAVGTDIYLLGSWVRGAMVYNYKYDTLTDTWTQKANIPVGISTGFATTFGTDVYVFYGTNTLKYDSINDSWSQLTNIPYTFSDGGGVKKDNKVYLLSRQQLCNKNSSICLRIKRI